MIPPASFRDHDDWPALEAAARRRVAEHGDTPRWMAALAALPDLTPEDVVLADRVTARGSITPEAGQTLREALAGLHPWRKGPFELFGVHVDTEWRSDLKWRRIAPALGRLDGQRVLDVGSGNGYFGWRLLEAGAAEVIGVDPAVLFYLQHRAISFYLQRLGPFANHLLPLPFEALPALPFDLVLSMGVVYHRPDPVEHLARLYRSTRPGGRLLLESLVVTEGEPLYPAQAKEGGGRYARMRNVHVVPSLPLLHRWLSDAGYEAVRTVDVSPTTVAEQRSTRWMRFESLAESLDPGDPGRTAEGYPAPVRAALLAVRPG